MNIWSFTGHLGKDCEVGTTKNGKTICAFSVAVTSGYGDNEKTTWASCVLFGKRAEGKLPEHLTVGQKVAISGEPTLETWEKQNGGTGFKLKVVVNTLDLIGVKQQQQQSQQQYQQAPQQNQAQMPQGNAQQVPVYPDNRGEQQSQRGPDTGQQQQAPQNQEEEWGDVPF